MGSEEFRWMPWAVVMFFELFLNGICGCMYSLIMTAQTWNDLISKWRHCSNPSIFWYCAVWGGAHVSSHLYTVHVNVCSIHRGSILLVRPVMPSYDNHSIHSKGLTNCGLKTPIAVEIIRKINLLWKCELLLLLGLLYVCLSSSKGFPTCLRM